jgi:hypothetical protein
VVETDKIGSLDVRSCVQVECATTLSRGILVCPELWMMHCVFPRLYVNQHNFL